MVGAGPLWQCSSRHVRGQLVHTCMGEVERCSGEAVVDVGGDGGVHFVTMTRAGNTAARGVVLAGCCGHALNERMNHD